MYVYMGMNPKRIMVITSNKQCIDPSSLHILKSSNWEFLFNWFFSYATPPVIERNWVRPQEMYVLL